MLSRGNLKRTIAAVVAGVLIGGGVTTVTPAGAEVSQFAGTNWKKIWKKKLQPRADQRYYTRSLSDARYTAAGSAYSKAEVDTKLGGYYTKAQSDAALGNYYTKVQADAAYAAKTQSYTKAESDAKYAPYPTVLRGTFSVVGLATGANQELSNSVSFGVQFPAAPIAHFINAGTAPPAGCSGTPVAPNADAGHLCVFENVGTNVSSRSVFGVGGIPGTVSPFGFNPYIRSAAAGTVYSYGSWAARPSGTVTSSKESPGAAVIGR